MCGQSGLMITNTTSVSELEIARRLMILNVLRGEHSAGMFDYMPHAEKNKQFSFTKSVEHPFDFILDVFDAQSKGRWKTSRPVILATHCRYATKGELKTENAHPFRHGKIIGMHNGTIKKEFLSSEKFKTDSEAFFFNLDRYGLEESLKEIQNKEAAYAFVWLNTKERTLNFIRNSKRPLSYTMLYNSKFGLVWSSEAAHLKVGISSVNSSMASSNPTSFKEMVHYSISVDAKEIAFNEVDYTHLKDTEFTHLLGAGYYDSVWDSSSNSWVPKGTVQAVSDSLAPEEVLKRYAKSASPIQTELSNKWDIAFSGFYSAAALQHIKYLRERVANGKKEKEKEAYKNADSKPYEKKIVTATMDSASNGGKDDVIPFNDAVRLGDSAGEEVFMFGPYYAKEASRARYVQLLREGCQNCMAKSRINEAIVWLNDKEYVCHECAKSIIEDSNHWFFNGGGIPKYVQARIKADYETLFVQPAQLN
jgi:predicted glutamine amidotransferase